MVWANKGYSTSRDNDFVYGVVNGKYWFFSKKELKEKDYRLILH